MEGESILLAEYDERRDRKRNVETIKKLYQMGQEDAKAENQGQLLNFDPMKLSKTYNLLVDNRQAYEVKECYRRRSLQHKKYSPGGLGTYENKGHLFMLNKGEPVAIDAGDAENDNTSLGEERKRRKRKARNSATAVMGVTEKERERHRLLQGRRLQVQVYHRIHQHRPSLNCRQVTPRRN